MKNLALLDKFRNKSKIEEIKAEEFHRAIGQIACYAHEEYTQTCVILLIVGQEPEMSEKIKELKAIVRQLRRVEFIYKQAANRTSK